MGFPFCLYTLLVPLFEKVQFNPWFLNFNGSARLVLELMQSSPVHVLHDFCITLIVPCQQNGWHGYLFFSLKTIFADLLIAWLDSMVEIMAVRKQKWSNLQQYLGKWLKNYCFVRKFARVDKLSLVNRNCSFIRVRWKGLSQCSSLFYSFIGSSCWLITITQRFKESSRESQSAFSLQGFLSLLQQKLYPFLLYLELCFSIDQRCKVHNWP